MTRFNDLQAAPKYVTFPRDSITIIVKIHRNMFSRLYVTML